MFTEFDFYLSRELEVFYVLLSVREELGLNFAPHIRL